MLPEALLGAHMGVEALVSKHAFVKGKSKSSEGDDW